LLLNKWLLTNQILKNNFKISKGFFIFKDIVRSGWESKRRKSVNLWTIYEKLKKKDTIQQLILFLLRTNFPFRWGRLRSLTSPRFALPGAMGSDSPKVPLELNKGALPHMSQRSEGFLQNPNSMTELQRKNCIIQTFFSIWNACLKTNLILIYS